MIDKREAQQILLRTLDSAVSKIVEEYSGLDRLDIYNTLQVLSWKVIERQPSVTSTVILNRKEG